MNKKLKDISQISIYIKDEADRINEVALFQPLNQKTAFDEKSRIVQQRKWNFSHDFSFLKKITFRIQKFIYSNIPFLIPKERQTGEAKFKTVLALLLTQESLRDFFLGHKKQRLIFFQAIKKTASSLGYVFETPEGETPLQISRNLTWIEGREASLLDDLTELNLQISALNYFERNEILFGILNEVERPPIQSVLEIVHGDMTDQIHVVTKYAKYHITDLSDKGRFTYTFAEDKATSSIRTLKNMQPHVLGAFNQRYVFDEKENRFIGAYCGELSTERRVLEQILLILHQKAKIGYLLDKSEEAEEKKIIFTSLYSWHEFGLMKDQQYAIDALNNKYLKTDSHCFKLKLLHFNISFNALNRYPSPKELSANMQDLNDEGLMVLTQEYLKKSSIPFPPLDALLEVLEEKKDASFLARQSTLLNVIDQFRSLKNEIANLLLEENYPMQALKALLLDKKRDGKILRGIDKLLYLDILIDDLGYFHTKNCKNSTDRSAGANAADKAQHAFKRWMGHPFLPCLATEEETSLFKAFYSMYLVWEEPEITTALSTGFLGEKFFNNFLQKNPETTYYLIDWLKKNPEIYLGLSEYRH